MRKISLQLAQLMQALRRMDMKIILFISIYFVLKSISLGSQVRLDWDICAAGHSLTCYSLTYSWFRNPDDTIYKPSINVSEPIMESKVCEEDMNICVKLEGSDGIEKRNIWEGKILCSGHMIKDCGMVDEAGAIHITYNGDKVFNR